MHKSALRLVFVALLLVLSASLVPATRVLAQEPSTVDEAMQQLRVIDGRRVALVIGNSRYNGGWPELANPANDARYIARLLSDPARGPARFEVTLVVDATREQIEAALDSFAAQAASADVAIVYIGGHGFANRAENYIVPVDAPLQVDETNVDGVFVNMADVVAAAGSRGFSLFFLDACRSPIPLVRISNRRDDHPSSLFGAINAPQTAVLYSTTFGFNAYDAAPPDAPLSPFAAAVGRAVNMPGLDVPYVFTLVRDAVQRATGAMNPVQSPQWGAGLSARFYFLPARSMTGPASTATPPPAALRIPLSTLATIDEPILVTRVLQDHTPAEMVRLAEAGDPLALYLVGYMLEFGVGLPRDLAAAREWLERAARTGHPAGQLELGYYLLVNGRGPADRARSLELYRAASAQGYAKAKSHLAAALLQGTFGLTDRDEAVRLYREAASQGHAFALHALAILDIDRDRNIAALQALAANGNAEGDNWLCEIAAANIPAQDASGHCIAAARAGYADARAHVALLYGRGEGVARSPDDARYWARLALTAPDLRADLRSQLAFLAN
jgi:TPR repeat protein